MAIPSILQRILQRKTEEIAVGKSIFSMADTLLISARSVDLRAWLVSLLILYISSLSPDSLARDGFYGYNAASNLAPIKSKVKQDLL